ncbi:MAG: alpha-amylase family glycosyl hydrolase [Chitinophagaceae bacterium]
MKKALFNLSFISSQQSIIIHHLFLIFLFIVSHLSSFAQEIYPTNWWVGMKHDTVQLLIRGENNQFNKEKIQINYPGVHLLQTYYFENGKYIAADVKIDASAKPGNINIEFISEDKINKVQWQLKEKRKGKGTLFAQGVTSSDLIYLLMPDRFSNGDKTNDKFADMNDTSCNRNNPFLRHGGDFQGIINHLNYFNDLGVTALWLTPVIENNQGYTNEGGTLRSAYHGYAFTNQYKIDKRFGGNEMYKKLIDSAHAHGLKIIQDAVYNHVGDKHFLYVDPPAKDWFNQWPAYTNTSYKDQPLVDEYSSQSDRNISVKGWFTPFLPDLNQQNPFVANYLIQHAIWTVEEFGIDGWRVDTYFYSDKSFLNKINEELYNNFPNISIFGETTMQSVTEQAYYMQNNLNVAWKSNLQGVTDYQWYGNALPALNENFGWNSGINKLYNILVQDILYKDPMRNEIFLDNHDQDRFYSVVGEDFNKYKMGIALLLTQRGIPTIYYGTEILMKNFKNPSDAEVRKDFPGGWKEDTVNKFIASGRTQQENDAYNYVKALAHFRMNSSALQTGKFMQYVPVDGLYVYFRYDDNQTVMCVANTSDAAKEIFFSNYVERTGSFSGAQNIETGENITNPFTIPSKTMYVLELKK